MRRDDEARASTHSSKHQTTKAQKHRSFFSANDDGSGGFAYITIDALSAGCDAGSTRAWVSVHGFRGRAGRTQQLYCRTRCCFSCTCKRDLPTLVSRLKHRCGRRRPHFSKRTKEEDAVIDTQSPSTGTVADGILPLAVHLSTRCCDAPVLFSPFARSDHLQRRLYLTRNTGRAYCCTTHEIVTAVHKPFPGPTETKPEPTFIYTT